MHTFGCGLTVSPGDVLPFGPSDRFGKEFVGVLNLCNESDRVVHYRLKGSKYGVCAHNSRGSLSPGASVRVTVLLKNPQMLGKTALHLRCHNDVQPEEMAVIRCANCNELQLPSEQWSPHWTVGERSDLWQPNHTPSSSQINLQSVGPDTSSLSVSLQVQESYSSDDQTFVLSPSDTEPTDELVREVVSDIFQQMAKLGRRSRVPVIFYNRLPDVSTIVDVAVRKIEQRCKGSERKRVK